MNYYLMAAHGPEWVLPPGITIETASFSDEQIQPDLDYYEDDVDFESE